MHGLSRHPPLLLVWAVLAICLLTFSTPAAGQQQGASYLGCFSFPRLLYMKGVEGVKVGKVDACAVLVLLEVATKQSQVHVLHSRAAMTSSQRPGGW